MVQDNHIHPKFTGKRDRLIRRCSAIENKENSGPIILEMLYGTLIDTVPFAQSLGNVTLLVSMP